MFIAIGVVALFMLLMMFFPAIAGAEKGFRRGEGQEKFGRTQ